MSSSLQRRREVRAAAAGYGPGEQTAVPASVRPWPVVGVKGLISRAWLSGVGPKFTLAVSERAVDVINTTRICFALLASLGGSFLPSRAN